MGRGGPAEPQLAEPGTGLERAAGARRATAATPHRTTSRTPSSPGCAPSAAGGSAAGRWASRRESNVAEGAALAASLEPGALILEGSGSCIPPVAGGSHGVRGGRPGRGPRPLPRSCGADLCLLMADAEVERRGDPLRAAPRAGGADRRRARAWRCSPRGARRAARGSSRSWRARTWRAARRSADDLDRAAAEGCDVYLTELKAAAIDTVAERAEAEGAARGLRPQPPVGARRRPRRRAAGAGAP